MLSPLSNPGFSMLWVANTLSLTGVLDDGGGLRLADADHDRR